MIFIRTSRQKSKVGEAKNEHALSSYLTASYTNDVTKALLT